MSIKIALTGGPRTAVRLPLFGQSRPGSNQLRVGNRPGVTVERRKQAEGARDVIIQDLPGIYSLSPYILEEVVPVPTWSVRPDAAS